MSSNPEATILQEEILQEEILAYDGAGDIVCVHETAAAARHHAALPGAARIQASVRVLQKGEVVKSTFEISVVSKM